MWQPIQSLPESECYVLVARFGKRATMASLPHTAFKCSDGRWCLASCELRSSKLGFRPTHWMPLPEPPTQVGSMD